MHDSTLDLFCDHIDDAFDAALEERAAFYEVTVDYYLEEFFCSENLDQMRVTQSRLNHTS